MKRVEFHFALNGEVATSAVVIAELDEWEEWIAEMSIDPKDWAILRFPDGTIVANKLLFTVQGSRTPEAIAAASVADTPADAMCAARNRDRRRGKGGSR